MRQSVIVICVCLICVLGSSDGAQKPVLSSQGSVAQGVAPAQPRDKEDPALMHLSATYRVDDIQFGVTGVPTYLRGDLTPVSGGGDPLQTSYAFFEDNAALFLMQDPRTELTVEANERDEIGMTHVSFRQTYRSIPVFFGELKTHFSTDGRLRTVNGDYFPGIDLPTQPRISGDAATAAVRSDLGVTADEIRVRETPALWVLPHNNEYYLSWHVIVDGPGWEAWRYFIDARTGEVVNRIPLVMPEQAVERPVPDREVLEELSQRPLESAQAEVYFGRDGTWFRSEGEYEYRPALIVDDVAAQITREQEAQARNAASDRRDFVLDLRDAEALRQAQAAGLVLQPLPETGYYRVYTSKQVINELGRYGIDAAVYPDLPGARRVQRNDDDKPRQADNPLDEVLFAETFEGIFPPAGWAVGDEDATNGLDYWDDLSCQHHNGGWSGWCADEGDMTDCVNYDDYMIAYMSTPDIDVYGRSHLNIRYWWRNISESNYDYFRSYVRLDNGGWIQLHQHTGSSPTWQQYSINITISGGGANLSFKFVFSSDYSIHSQEGAYVDDIELTGDWANCGYVGYGVGMMGDWRDHVDAMWSWTDAVYHLEDKTRCQNTWDCQHTHGGQMRNDQSVTSWDGTDGVHFTDGDNAWNEPTGIDAQYFTTAFYDFLLSQLNRNSYDATGSGLYGIVNDPTCFNNAFGGGATIRYCAPGTGRRGTAGCPDVIAHEWGHSLTVSESNLAYQRESGALNEGFSDILGAAFGVLTGLDNDWLIGENTFIDGSAWRDMQDPQVYGQPECYLGANWYPCDPVSCPTPWNGNDQCGVHTNSGVPNRMFTLLSNGGTENGVTVNGIGVLNALRVVYRANCQYWTSGTGMSAGRAGCISAAQDLNSAWVTDVTNAWAAVCVGSAVETPLDCAFPITLQNGVPYDGTTANGAGHVLNYNCSAWTESGPEKVHVINVTQASNITVSLSNLSVDLDIFLLSACDDNACLTYGNNSVSFSNALGTYYVVVDGYYGAVGSYTLQYCIAPGTAALISPASGTTFCGGTPILFDWTDVYGAGDYTWQWDDNGDFSPPRGEYTATTSSFSYDTWTPGAIYWRVRANGPGACADGSWSNAWSITVNTAPGIPAIVNPAANASLCSGAVTTYSWTSAARATVYRIQWDDQLEFIAPIAHTTADTSFALAITGSGTWYWRVRAENSCGNGSWSTPRNFVLYTVPAQITLSAPANGATVCVGVATTYSWAPIVGGTPLYQIQWDEDPNFGSPLEQTSGISNINYAINTAGTFYWRVRASSSCGVGPWSVSRTVNVVAPPAQAVLTSPAAGAEILSGVSQSYCWNAVPNATSYTIQWADNTSFTSPIEAGSSTTCYDQTLTGYGIRYWRVRANGACGLGAWSAPRDVVLVGLQPPTVVMWMDGDSLRLSWPAMPSADAYLIEVASTPNGTYGPLTVQPDTTHGIALDPAVRASFFRVRTQVNALP